MKNKVNSWYTNQIKKLLDEGVKLDVNVIDFSCLF